MTQKALLHAVCRVGALTLAGLLLAVTPAWASGGHTHEYVSLRAVDDLPDGALRSLVSDPALQPMLMNGSVFPDGGYATGNGYGETAHWEPFQRPLLAHIRKTYPLLEKDPLARPVIAFWLGMVSHGMADQIYDALFMDSAHVHDAATWQDTMLTSFDSASDVFKVAQKGPSPIPEAWLPTEDLLAVFQQIGDPAPEETLHDGQTLMTTVVLGYPKTAAGDAQKVSDLRAMYPWGYDNLFEPSRPGNPVCQPKVVAAYWQSLWEELHGAAPTMRVMASVPTSGASHPYGLAADPDSKVAVVLSRGVDEKTLAADAVVVRDAKGQVLPAEQNLFYGQNSHVIRLLPKGDWPQGQLLHLEVHAGIRSWDGVVLSHAESIPFTIGTAKPKEPGQPPPSSPWQLRGAASAAAAASVADQGSCLAGRSPRAAPVEIGLVFLTAWALGLRRRKTC